MKGGLQQLHLTCILEVDLARNLTFWHSEKGDLTLGSYHLLAGGGGGRLFVGGGGGPEFFGVVKGGDQNFFSGSKGGTKIF